MSSISAASGQIWTVPIKYGPGETTDAGFDAANGITPDPAIEAMGGSDSETLAFLDSLTPAQLSEKTVGNFEEGAAVTTYGDLKLYRQTQMALDDQVSALVTRSSLVGAGHLNLSQGNTSDLEIAQIGVLLGNLMDNAPGAVTAAQFYLKSSQSRQDSFANTSWQTVQREVQTQSAYETVNPDGNWAASSGADTALTALKSAAAIHNLNFSAL
jgi:hypothetical protein